MAIQDYAVNDWAGHPHLSIDAEAGKSHISVARYNTIAAGPRTTIVVQSEGKAVCAWLDADEAVAVATAILTVRAEAEGQERRWLDYLAGR